MFLWGDDAPIYKCENWKEKAAASTIDQGLCNKFVHVDFVYYSSLIFGSCNVWQI